ncbi:MAG: glycosyltransferase [Thaumarchaeota archaeon]|nr:glycosyltransferase [Nitrososphaerota archaeon]
MSLTEHITSPSDCTVGICATGQAEDTPALVSLVLAESFPEGLQLKKVIVVASECSETTVSKLRAIQKQENRVQLVSEEVRHGKADAINKILTQAKGDMIVFVNSDAHPQSGAISHLLSILTADGRVGAVSAMPVTQRAAGVAFSIADLMWATHNQCSLTLNHMNLSNHTCDELVAFRSKALTLLPEGLVNDGAFMASTARRKGYTVKFSTAAKVGIETPQRVSDLIGQRRRILFGHAQVWRRVGKPPRTVESLLVFSPSIGLRLLTTTVSRCPRYLLVLPVAVVTEFVASVLAVWDGLRSTKRHTVWRRFT